MDIDRHKTFRVRIPIQGFDAAAYAGLGASYVLLQGYANVPVREANPKARAAARRALELDGRLAEAHAVLGRCAQYD